MKQYTPVAEIQIDRVSRLLGEVPKPKRVRRMGKIIIDPNIEYQILEISNRIVDKNEHQIIEEDFSVSHIDMGPSNNEGDIYNGNFSMGNLSKREKSKKKKNQGLT